MHTVPKIICHGWSGCIGIYTHYTVLHLLSKNYFFAHFRVIVQIFWGPATSENATLEDHCRENFNLYCFAQNTLFLGAQMHTGLNGFANFLIFVNFPIPCESVDAMTRLNCLRFGGFFAGDFYGFTPHTFGGFFCRLFFHIFRLFLWLFLWLKWVQYRAITKFEIFSCLYVSGLGRSAYAVGWIDLCLF